MNKANLKSYAPKARLDFIKAVTERANVLGISAAGTVPAQLRGDVVIIDGREWPAKVAGQRDELIARIKRHGFEQTMDEVAYTWFNRFAALRYMEIHDYLGHGWRVLSSRDGGLPEILRHASEVTLPGVKADRAREMQLAGNQDNELYKLLLVAQCNDLSRVMPFLFERIDDETELLLPENLLRTDSIVAKLVESVPEEDWQEIEVIGWLYQFYISERKDLVMGKVVKSEDIPAATQLFTPNWIVQYLVQNSVGRLWLMANPTSTLASQWAYYLQPAVQTPDVQAQLDALIQTRIRKDGETLNPETITVLDPACGSGHILVVAYDVLKAIYLERGYQPRSIPRLILEKNLYGLEIDDRAGQLASFALLMKARADDRRLFNDPPKLNVLSLQSSKGMEANELATHLTPFGLQRESIKILLDTFENTKTFGSLIQVPTRLNIQLTEMTIGLQQAFSEGDLYAKQSAKDLLPIVAQASLLGMQFDAVTANPPYMGSKGMNEVVKAFARSNYPDTKSDLFSMFIDRGFHWCGSTGFNSMVTMQSWMFLASHESMREQLISTRAISSFVQIGYNSFPEINSKIAQACAFCILNRPVRGLRGCYINLNAAPQSADKSAIFLTRGPEIVYDFDQDALNKLPGKPIAYWASENVQAAFEAGAPLASIATPKKGMITSDNGRFLRLWHEVSFGKIGLLMPTRSSALKSGAHWFPYNKGGERRRWFGNGEYVLDWSSDGEAVVAYAASLYGSASRQIQNTESYFHECLTWGAISSSGLSVRRSDCGFIFDSKGPSIFGDPVDLKVIHGFLSSKLADHFLRVLNSTMDYLIGNLSALPIVQLSSELRQRLIDNVDEAVSIARKDWNRNEISWDFSAHQLLGNDCSASCLAEAWTKLEQDSCSDIARMLRIERENNEVLIHAYGLRDELTPDYPEDQVTLARSDREKDSQRLISYAVGCMMGRYSLDAPGVIYAHAGNAGFDPSRYEAKFQADADGILPLTYERWFEDDAASRVRKFLRAVWGSETLEENVTWLAESIGTKGSEVPDETICRYLAGKFFKDHLQTYKKRPIYWLFSSGKQGAFQALVYLHRYNESTLARMRAEYVVPMIAKVVSRLDMLDKDVESASSAAARTKLQKQIESLRKKQIELLTYDEKLRHYADMRITLDLDDGVKVNYAKFGDLVAESKAITGGSDD